MFVYFLFFRKKTKKRKIKKIYCSVLLTGIYQSFWNTISSCRSCLFYKTWIKRCNNIWGFSFFNLFFYYPCISGDALYNFLLHITDYMIARLKDYIISLNVLRLCIGFSFIEFQNMFLNIILHYFFDLDISKAIFNTVTVRILYSIFIDCNRGLTSSNGSV